MYSLFSGLSMAEISGLTAIAIASCIFLSTLILPYSIFLAAFRWLDTLFHTSILLPLGLSSRVKLVYNKASSVKVGDSDLVALIKHNCPHLYGPQAWYTPPIWMLGSGHVQVSRFNFDSIAVMTGYFADRIMRDDGLHQDLSYRV